MSKIYPHLPPSEEEKKQIEKNLKKENSIVTFFFNISFIKTISTDMKKLFDKSPKE